MVVVFFTWSGYPHPIVEFGRERGIDPGPGRGVEGGGIVILWSRHVRAVGTQHVRLGGWIVQIPSRVGQIQEAATAPQTARRAQTFRLQAVMELGALPALSAGRGASVSGAGEGGGVEGAGGVGVQWGLGEEAAAPGGDGWIVRRAQGMASRPIEQLQITEGAGGGQHLTDCGEQQRDEVTQWKRGF